ncbi:putative transglutaminase-like cysteine proteinase [Gellertiella hungarica]|uniref:Putative transglutaminase-like cysteine proteinase n=1 Tax=Gellertiella hungarica TaxID=1572859 RepID=A0A7W6NMF9_9HYPH|nr:transglutaminase-like cysteine peptidase [Gellertiella hungarica]MBB4066415.1 putative transglutaminase-like cysteine proteinase [Gellertiella hungarica]
MIKRLKVAQFLGALLAVAATASAATPSPNAMVAMITGSVTSQPIGHYEFCRTNPSECHAIKSSLAAPRITEAGWKVVRDINLAVNREITPVTDQELFGRDEVWAYPVNAGDCEDFVLAKRKILMQKGFPESSLLITVVRKPDGEGHAVLTLRTASGDFVLDNLEDEVKPWYRTPYTYLKRQATFDSGRWVSIENGADVLVGALQ